MALQLKNQFGIQKAWIEFVNVRGVILSPEDAEKADAFKVFCKKVDALENMTKCYKDFELESFM